MDASRIADKKYIYLTTTGRKTGNPHTVELWFAIAGNEIYLSHEGAYTDWMKNILQDSRVEFKIGKTQFKGNGRIAEAGQVFELGKHALYLKYCGKTDEDTINEWFSESTITEISMIGMVQSAK